MMGRSHNSTLEKHWWEVKDNFTHTAALFLSSWPAHMFSSFFSKKKKKNAGCLGPCVHAAVQILVKGETSECLISVWNSWYEFHPAPTIPLHLSCSKLDYSPSSRNYLVLRMNSLKFQEKTVLFCNTVLFLCETASAHTSLKLCGSWIGEVVRSKEVSLSVLA